MRHTVSFVTTLAVLWLLLSGHYSPLLLTLGAVSCALVAWLAHRMTAVDAETQPWHLGLPLFGYWLWLAGAIARANVKMVRRILHPRLPIDPAVVHVRAHERTELGQTIFANSITLTPGTVSVGLSEGAIRVHAISHTDAANLEGGAMDRWIRSLERQEARP